MTCNQGTEWGFRTALVAEHHEVFRIALSRILQDDCGFRSVVEVDCQYDAFKFLAERPDLTLATLDLRMPGMDEFLAIQRSRRLYPQLRLAVVTASERRQDMLAALAAGVHGYVPKTFSRERIATALNMVLRGYVFFPWSMTEVATAEPNHLTEEVERSQANPKLTARQMEVLRLIRMGKSNRSIAKELSLAESTIKVHANAIFRVLGVRNRVSAAFALLDSDGGMRGLADQG